ncbi:MAG: hypothetical protein P1T08_14235 [Acidimicrobiia bacterium]|nr:hypothetical protein [Acidimicrobiia bacterium]
MQAKLVGNLVDPPRRVDIDGVEPLIALRSWLIVPERLPRDRSRPMLTGLFGFPWKTRSLEARCTAAGHLNNNFTLPPRIERHHPTVPEPECTCGIYAVRAESLDRIPLSTPVGVPVATGFVELSGRVVAGGTTLRAQRATIIGPLAISAGRSPIIPHLLRRSVHPQRVITINPAYQVRWTARPPGHQWLEWMRHTAHALRNRYEVEVLAEQA